MKLIRLFNGSYFRPAYLRLAVAGSLVVAGAALGFTAWKASSPPALADSDRQSESMNKFRQDLDELLGNKVTRPGVSRDKGPAAAALAKLQLRAYPAADVSPDATRNAIASFKNLQTQTAAAKPGGNPSQWQLIGPSTAVFPPILTFSGAQYVTSGRITALAIAPTCTANKCRVYLAAAGGGVWRTDTALGTPTWTFVSSSFASNAIGSLLIDPRDSKGDTIYAGTGEPNASNDSEAGVGVYKSTDGGSTWALVPGTDIFFQRAIHQMAFDNAGNLLVPIASAVRGVSSVTSGALSSGSTDHPLVTRGLYRCNGTSCTRIFTAPAPTRGSTTVRVDPTHPGIIYVNAFGGGAVAGDGGVWRSTDNGATFSQIFQPKDVTSAAFNAAIERDEFDITTLPNGATRMYVGAGTLNSPANGDTTAATFWRSDDVSSTTIAPFQSLGGAQVLNYCTGQCWYDNVVFTPKGFSDTVYLAGSFVYGELNGVSNARGVLLSRDGGVTWTDQTRDATTGAPPAGSCCNGTTVAGNSIHPDQHAIVVNPNNPLQFFEGSDGGIVRSTGTLSDISSQCGAVRGLTGDAKTFCEGLLKAVPSQIFSLNTGLSTLQFQSVSVAADNAKHVQGGTQDNGTWDNNGSTSTTWPQIIYGDGGQSGFSATNSALRFNTFTGQANDANFRNGDPSKWVIISAPILSSPEGAYFYPPIVADPHPANAGTIFQGSFSVWRTQDWGGNQALLEANCPEFTTSATQPGCGDFVQIGGGNSDLTASTWGDREGGAIAWLQRTRQNTGTLWAATGTGRVFVTDNADSATASVGWTRLEKKHTNDPGRAISAIYVDPANPHRAWISYNGYNVNTPATPGHVFEVNWAGTGNGAGGIWTDISYNLPDFPITALVRDDVTGDLYAGSDFTVMRLPAGSTTWTTAGTGLPMVEVPGLTIVPSARVLYAATHGRSVWSLALP
jgi:hypothetical protein